jgi:hypothetical protein
VESGSDHQVASHGQPSPPGPACNGFPSDYSLRRFAQINTYIINLTNYLFFHPSSPYLVLFNLKRLVLKIEIFSLVLLLLYTFSLSSAGKEKMEFTKVEPLLIFH